MSCNTHIAMIALAGLFVGAGGKARKKELKLEACQECGKIFYDVANASYCPECWNKLERKLQEVTKYLSENSRAGIEDIISDCGVGERQIYQWMKEKRLNIKEESPIRITCKKCGDLICAGKLCRKCERLEQELLYDLAKAFRGEYEPPHRRMG